MWHLQACANLRAVSPGSDPVHYDGCSNPGGRSPQDAIPMRILTVYFDKKSSNFRALREFDSIFSISAENLPAVETEGPFLRPTRYLDIGRLADVFLSLKVRRYLCPVSSPKLFDSWPAASFSGRSFGKISMNENADHRSAR